MKRKLPPAAWIMIAMVIGMTVGRKYTRRKKPFALRISLIMIETMMGTQKPTPMLSDAKTKLLRHAIPNSGSMSIRLKLSRPTQVDCAFRLTF